MQPTKTTPGVFALMSFVEARTRLRGGAGGPVVVVVIGGKEVVAVAQTAWTPAEKAPEICLTQVL